MNRKRKTYQTQESHKSQVPQSSNNSGTLSTLKETVVAGFGIGAGSEIAHRVVSSILGPRTVEVTHSKPLNACQEILQKYEKCIKQTQQNDLCTNDLENYKKCIRES